MPDRDKVIKRLEECLSASCRGFRTCPYSDDAWDAVKSALALLREQKPVEPKKGIWLYPTSLDCCCSVCGMSPELNIDGEVPTFPYCPYCGTEMEV